MSTEKETTFCTHKGYNTVAPCDDSCFSQHSQSESIEWEEIFQLVMADIEKRYRVSDSLSDVLSDSLSKHLPNAITTAVAKAGKKAYAEGFEDGCKAH